MPFMEQLIAVIRRATGTCKDRGCLAAWRRASQLQPHLFPAGKYEISERSVCKILKTFHYLILIVCPRNYDVPLTVRLKRVLG